MNGRFVATESRFQGGRYAGPCAIVICCRIILRQRMVVLLQQNERFQRANAGPSAIVIRCMVTLRQRMAVVFTHSYTHLLTHSLTHSFAPSLQNVSTHGYHPGFHPFDAVRSSSIATLGLAKASNLISGTPIIHLACTKDGGFT